MTLRKLAAELNDLIAAVPEDQDPEMVITKKIAPRQITCDLDFSVGSMELVRGELYITLAITRHEPQLVMKLVRSG